jgi:4-hydroxy-L-threonine phosphate dehydrogenase PdxA
VRNEPTSIAIAIGDPNGIGPEIAVKAALRFAQGPAPRLILVGDGHVVRHYANLVAPGVLVTDDTQGLGANEGAIRFHPTDALTAAAFSPGTVCPEAGRATVAYVREAIALVRSGVATAIVACPHSETAVNAGGIKFSGYPNLLAELTGRKADDVFLMLAGGGKRIVHVTLHEPLAAALARLTPELIERAIRATDRALHAMGVEAPRIGVFGINPHAGEGGLFGDDDDRLTRPVADKLRADGLLIDGPQGADMMLSTDACDAYVAMYHDQGHIPIKLLAGRDAAAASIGSDVIFSSVGHGSAFDIAGQGLASPAALLRAIALVSGRPLPEGGMK